MNRDNIDLTGAAIVALFHGNCFSFIEACITRTKHKHSNLSWSRIYDKSANGDSTDLSSAHVLSKFDYSDHAKFAQNYLAT